MRWPHMFLTLYRPMSPGRREPTISPCATYAARCRVRQTVKRRMYRQADRGGADADQARAGIKAIWFQAITEAAPIRAKNRFSRLRRAIFRDGGANEIATAGDPHLWRPGDAESLRWSGLSRSRCGSLMLPWTAGSVSTASGRERCTRRAN